MAIVCSVNCSGTSTGSKCVAYGNCPTSCCTEAYTSCSGTTTGCPGKTQAECTAMGACCSWGGGPPASCRNVTCVGMSESNCGTCSGCTEAGTCTKKSCASVGTTNLFLCSGCDECSGTITVTLSVDLTGYWSCTGRVWTLQGVGANITQDSTHKMIWHDDI